MRIWFEFSGGYGGLFAAQPLALDLDAAALLDSDRDELLTLIGEAKLLEQTAQPSAGSRAARDSFQYKLEIEDRGVNRAYGFDDVSAPAAVRPLLQFLQKLAMQRRAAD